MKKIVDAKRDHLTYGEAVQLELDSMQLVNGEWQQTIQVVNKPPRMQRKEASIFYNKKMFLYFKEQMLRTSRHKKHIDKQLSYLMFKDPNRYKELGI